MGIIFKYNIPRQIERGVIMFDYKEIEKRLHAALLSGNIDIRSYHLMCKQIKDLESQAPTHTYTELIMTYASSMK